MTEFDLIRRHFAELSSPTPDVIVGIGDDAAVLNPPADHELVIALDVLNEGVHFPVDTSAGAIAHKALAVNLSDLAAMGAEPLWFTLGLTLPEASETWLADFAGGLRALADRAGIALVGGDTTRGPLSVAVNVCGAVPRGEALTRSGAVPGDAIALTGTLGAPALGLAVATGGDHASLLNAAAKERVRSALDYPEPALAAGLAIREFASAAIDVSDGLAQDLGHILTASGVGARIDLDALPLCDDYAANLDTLGFADALGFGDEYVLCCTLPATTAEAAVAAVPGRLSIIGEVVTQPGIEFVSAKGYRSGLEARQGFEHFTDRNSDSDS